MPFTLSHAAAVLPIHKALSKWGVLSALILGSFVPDLAYFLPSFFAPSLGRSFTHSLIGILYFSLPWGLFLFYFFHVWLKNPLIDFLNPQIQSYFKHFRSNRSLKSPCYLIQVSFCLVLGTLTHIVWDSLTHEISWFSEFFPFVLIPLIKVGYIEFNTCKILQQFSSLLGLIVVLASVVKWKKQNHLPDWKICFKFHPIKWFILICGLSFYFHQIILLFFRHFPHYNMFFWQFYVLEGLFQCLSHTLGSLFVFALVWRLLRLFKPIAIVYTLPENKSLDLKQKFSMDYEFKSHHGNTLVTLTKNGILTVYAQYSWDGCTPKFSLFDLVIGTPEGVPHTKSLLPKTYTASLFHDAVYQFLDHGMPFTRKEADKLFYQLLKQSEFKMAWFYYCMVRLFGNFFKKYYNPYIYKIQDPL